MIIQGLEKQGGIPRGNSISDQENGNKKDNTPYFPIQMNNKKRSIESRQVLNKKLKTGTCKMNIVE